MEVDTNQASGPATIARPGDARSPMAEASTSARAARNAGAAMWVRIAGAIEREAAAAPGGEDRDLAERLAAGIRARVRPHRVQ
jgi:hypothetical protein